MPQIVVYKPAYTWYNGYINDEESTMTLREKISEGFGYVLITVFAAGWMDIGFGPEYTWWNLIYTVSN
tara:strand:+ start:232 stop:435 length:204 start_codon:yes stop_codon:yes gene_type:complete